MKYRITIVVETTDEYDPHYLAADSEEGIKSGFGESFVNCKCISTNEEKYYDIKDKD